MKNRFPTILILMMLLFSCATPKMGIEKIQLIKSPMNGMTPQVQLDSSGVMHLSIFVKKENTKNKTGNIFYLKKNWNQKKWSTPIRVNENKDSVKYAGIISHHQMAITKSGAIHITWFQPKNGKYLYSYLSPTKKKFTKPISMVSRYTLGHEAGATLASPSVNNIFFFFSAGDFNHEDKRQIYYRRSKDGGRTFDEERPFSNKVYGSCACCGISANYNKSGEVAVLYRSAQNFKYRDMRLTKGESISKNSLIHPWPINACPVSTNFLGKNFKMAFETKGQIFFQINEKLTPIKVSTDSNTRNKNPHFSTDNLGNTLIVWGKAHGLSKGGQLHYRLLDKNLNTKSSKAINTQINIKNHSRAFTVVLPNQNFLIFY